LFGVSKKEKEEEETWIARTRRNGDKEKEK
jgi:hypothetical protein